MADMGTDRAEDKVRAEMFRARGLTKVYRMGEVEVHALRGIDLALYPGEFVVILGPSGCGKSTLLNILGGLDVPTEGEVWYNGHDLTHADDAILTRFRRDNVGFVFQFYNLIPSLTARENVAIVTEIARQPMPPEEALALVGLGERLDHFPAQMSGGEQQRVAIARAIAKQPAVLLCDEPTSALDTETTRSVLATLKEINQRLGVTIVIVTHELSVVLALCRQAAVVEQGLLVEKLDLDGSAPLAPVSALGRELVQHLHAGQGRGSVAAQGAAGRAQGSLDTTGGAQAPQA